MPSQITSRGAAMWFGVLVWVSALLVLITFVSFAVQGSVDPSLSLLLFQIGLGGENNVGAWWSGMLLLLAAAFAFDGYAEKRNSEHARRGWLILSLILVMLSFDELASLHEYLGNVGNGMLLLPGLLGAGMALYTFHQLIRARAGARVIVPLLAAFALLATVPIQETIQHSREWNNPVVYGVRALLEEGIEILALLIFVAVTRSNSQRASASGERSSALALTAVYRTPLIIGGAVCVPVLTWATFVLPYPGGPADWLAASLYLLCALHVVRAAQLTDGRPRMHGLWPLLALYLVASLFSNALNVAWDPEVLGTRISFRGIMTCVLLLSVALVLHRSGRSMNPLWLPGAALVALAAAVLLPASQAFWCAFPPLVALYVYAIESRYAEDSVAVALPAGPPTSTRVQTVAGARGGWGAKPGQ